MIKMIKQKTEKYFQEDFNYKINFFKNTNSCSLQVNTEQSGTQRAENF